MGKTYKLPLRISVLALTMVTSAMHTHNISANEYLTYSIQQLGCCLPEARDINDFGIAAGTAALPDPQPAYWDENGLAIDLEPTFGIDEYGTGRAINNLGEVIGEMSRPRWYTQGTALDLLDLNGDARGTAADINDNSLIVGCVYDPGGLTRTPVVWPNSVNSIVIPGTPVGADACAQAVNNAGQIAGLQRIDGGYRAVLWQDGNFVVLGNLPGHAVTIPTAINDLGQVVGYSQQIISGPARAFLWDNGTMTDLGTLGGESAVAFDINNAGEIVGNAPTPVLWKNGVIYDLKPLLPSSTRFNAVRGINESGQIVSDGFIVTPAPGGFDLSIALNGSSDPVEEGNPVTYEIKVVNLSRQTATAVVMSDVLPPEFEFVSAVSSHGDCQGSQTITCSLGDIAGGGSANVTIQATPFVNSNISLKNQVSISANESVNDINSFNNTAVDFIAVKDIPPPAPPSADTSVMLSFSPFPVVRRQPLNVYANVINRGPETAVNATLIQSFPSSVIVSSVTTSTGNCSVGQTVRCQFGNLPSGQQVNVSVVTKPRRQGLITITAEVASDILDLNTSNNSASMNLYVFNR